MSLDKSSKTTSANTKPVVGDKSTWSLRRFSVRQYGLVVIGLLVIAGGILLFAATSTPFASINADNGQLANGATVATDSQASDGKYVKFPASTGGGGGSGSLLFNGTFSTTLSGGSGHGTANYPIVYADSNSLTMLSPTIEQYHVLGSVSLSGNEGHPRADLTTPNLYTANESTPLYTSVTFQFPNASSIPGASWRRNNWLQFAEAKDTGAAHAGWSMNLGSSYDSSDTASSPNHLQFGVTPSYYSPPIWDSGVPIDSNWHTLTVESNYGNSGNGWVKLWYDGNPVTFGNTEKSGNPAEGKQQTGNFSVINDGASSWPLDINLYMGSNFISSTQTVVVNHGAPLIGTSLDAVKPPHGWTSSP